MFIRISRSGGREYLRLVQAYRDDNGKVRQRQLAQLGRVDQLDEREVNGLIDSLRRFTGHGVEDVSAETSEPQFERARELGPTWLLTELWQTLGLKDLLRQALRSSRRSFDVESAVRLMVFNRLCDPDSKLGVLRWLEEVVVPGIEPGVITHQHLLRALDALMDKRDVIQRGLARQLLPLLDQELSVVFYDLTTIRIHGEGKVEDDIRQFGLSKELGGVARQFVLALVQTAEGLPLDFEVFEGNIAEVKTLLPMLRRCVKRYPIKRTIVVADRGLLSLDNIEQVEALEVDGRSLDYILAVPANRYGDFAPAMQGMRFAEGGESVREGTVERFGKRRVVVAYSPVRASEQGERRRAKLAELSEFGEALANKLDAQDEGKRSRGRKATDHGAYARFEREVHDARMSHFFTREFTEQRFSFEVNEAAVHKAEALDGKLVLLTNVHDIEAEDIVGRYKALADIERGFRVLKRDLDIAPVYHRKPERIRAHAFVCFLALLLNRVMRMRLKANGAKLSVERAVDRLRAIQLHRVQLGQRTLRGLTTMTSEQLELFTQLEVSKPTAAAV